MLKLTYHVTEEDYLNFNLFHLKHSKTAINAMRAQRFMGPGIFILASIILPSILDIPFLFLFTPLFIASVLWFVYFPDRFYKRVTSSVKKMLREGKNEHLIGEHVMVMTDEGIVETSPASEMKVNWSGIKQLNENEQYFFLFNSSMSAFIVPKRDLPNVEEIREYLKEKIQA